MPRYVNPGRNLTNVDMGGPTRKLVRLTPLGAPCREGDYGAIEMSDVKALDFVRMRMLREANAGDVIHGPVFDLDAAERKIEDAVNARVARLRRS